MIKRLWWHLASCHSKSSPSDHALNHFRVFLCSSKLGVKSKRSMSSIVITNMQFSEDQQGTYGEVSWDKK